MHSLYSAGLSDLCPVFLQAFLTPGAWVASAAWTDSSTGLSVRLQDVYLTCPRAACSNNSGNSSSEVAVASGQHLWVALQELERRGGADSAVCGAPALTTLRLTSPVISLAAQVQAWVAAVGPSANPMLAITSSTAPATPIRIASPVRIVGSPGGPALSSNSTVGLAPVLDLAEGVSVVQLAAGGSVALEQLVLTNLAMHLPFPYPFPVWFFKFPR